MQHLIDVPFSHIADEDLKIGMIFKVSRDSSLQVILMHIGCINTYRYHFFLLEDDFSMSSLTSFNREGNTNMVNNMSFYGKIASSCIMAYALPRWQQRVEKETTGKLLYETSKHGYRRG